MNSDVLDAKMRAGEAYHALRVSPGLWPIVRVDGRGFTRLCRENYAAPFDAVFHDCMKTTALFLMDELGGLFTSVHSDEISVLLPPSWSMFDREVEKTVSVAAGLSSASFTVESGLVGTFDGRLWVGDRAGDVLDYYSWRQADSERGCLNATAYWMLRREGLNERQASRALNGLHNGQRLAMLTERKIVYEALPSWQRLGTILFRETYDHRGYNPKTHEDVIVQRRRINQGIEPPQGEEYRALIAGIIQSSVEGQAA